jgi:signal transduction protein with GAF and PtsI domain
MPIEEKDVEQWLLDNPEEADLMLARLNIQRKSVTTLETENFLFDIAHRLTSSLNVDHIVQYVLECAIKLIHAEKCSVFLLDEKAQELYSIAFDVGNGDTALASGSDSVRIKIGTGIAGQVAKEKAGQNIPDVYQNPDFNASMDKKFGTRTKSMLCFPIMETDDNSKDNLIGVSYLINKIDDDGNRV